MIFPFSSQASFALECIAERLPDTYMNSSYVKERATGISSQARQQIAAITYVFVEMPQP